MKQHIFPQGLTLGATFIGLDATPTGSDPSADVVADFTGATALTFDAPSVAVPILHTPSQTLGSTFKIQLEGIWVVSARIQCITAATVFIGLGIDNTAAELNTDPALPTTARTLDRAVRIATTADQDAVRVSSDPIIVTRDLANNAAGALVRLLLSNGAGAGAAAASLSLANCFISFKRIADAPAKHVA